MRPGRNEAVDRADLYLTIRGPWSIAFVLAPAAQRLLCEEIARAIPGVLRSLGDYADYDAGAEYHAVVHPMEVER